MTLAIPLEGESELGIILDLDEDVVMQDAADGTGEYTEDTILEFGDAEVFTEFMENTLATLDTLGERWDGMEGGKFGSVLEMVSVLFI